MFFGVGEKKKFGGLFFVAMRLEKRWNQITFFFLDSIVGSIESKKDLRTADKGGAFRARRNLRRWI